MPSRRGARLKPATYGYRVNLHERGMFSADVVEDDGHELYEIRSDDAEGIVAEIEDGWMKYTGDVHGLTAYLVHLGIIAEGSRILPMAEAERQWERTRPVPRRTRKNPRNRRVLVSADDIAAFRRGWPVSGLPRNVSIGFEYDGKGNLVNYEWSDGDDHWDAETSGALSALADDARDGKIGQPVVG